MLIHLHNPAIVRHWSEERRIVRHWFEPNGERVGNLRDLQAKSPRHKAFKAYAPGYLHVDVKYLPQMADEFSRRSLFVAIDRATRWAFNRIYNSKTAANTDAIVAFDDVEGATEITGPGTTIAELPAGPINLHWTKDIFASPDGTKLFATVGSNSNVGENGIENEKSRAAVLEVEIATGTTRIFASGIRNPNGLSWQPDSGALWVTVNERDEIGGDLVPDYMTSVQDGGFYGWPYSYFGQTVDTRVEPPRPDLVATAIVPDYAFGAHTGSLGLTFNDEALFPARYVGGAFIGQHGSWNRTPIADYRVIFVPFADGMPAGTDNVIMRRTPPDHRGVIQGRHLQIGAEPNDRAGRRAKAQKARLQAYCPDQQDQDDCGGQHPFGFHIRATGRKTRPISISPPPR